MLFSLAASEPRGVLAACAAGMPAASNAASARLVDSLDIVVLLTGSYSDEGQDDQDQQQQAEPAGGEIAPRGAVRPYWERPDQQEDEQNDQKKSHRSDTSVKEKRSFVTNQTISPPIFSLA